MKDLYDTVSSVSSLSSSEAESDDEPLKPRKKKQKIEEKGNRERSKVSFSPAAEHFKKDFKKDVITTELVSSFYFQSIFSS